MIEARSLDGGYLANQQPRQLRHRRQLKQRRQERQQRFEVRAEVFRPEISLASIFCVAVLVVMGSSPQSRWFGFGGSRDRLRFVATVRFTQVEARGAEICFRVFPSIQ